ncbi:MAG: TlyA family RNA methyltransferase [Desulfovibrionaceae bacterium]|nr:TlyA family RNA methyltransferase [Desulfovibrionaceae bacterium]
MIAKARADELVCQQGLADSREQARRLIMAGKVVMVPPPSAQDQGACREGQDLGKRQANGAPEPVLKPGHAYRVGTVFALVGQERFVSRGAYKLLTALDSFGLDVTGLVCLDAGASTGGFTDCLLQHGAARVYAVDVGHAQLHERLRADERVISREGVNLRSAPADLIPEPVDMIVADLSFISLTLVLPACLRWLKPGGLAVGLIKPQFEVGPHQTRKGVVRDETVRQQAVDMVLRSCGRHGLICLGVVPAAIRGPKGNQEFLACWRLDRGGDAPSTGGAGA